VRHDGSDASFDDVGVELDAAVVEETGEPLPMVLSVADRIRDRRLARDARELLCEPGFEFEHKRLALLLAEGAPLIRAPPADRLLDRIDRRDAHERLARNRCVAVLGDIEELAAQMTPTESERDRLAAWFVGDGLVGRVSVALDDAAVILEQLQGVDRTATGRVAVGDGGRIGPAPGPVVAGNRPEVALLGAAAAGIEHRRHRLVHRDLARGQNEFAQPKINRHQFGRCIADPESEGCALVEPLREQHLRLAIQRQMPGVFGNQDGGDHGLGRQPALDQPFRRRRLNHPLRAGAADIFGTVRHDHPELCRNDVEPLRGLFADHLHGRSAAGAIRVLGLDRHIHTRQMRGKRAAVGAALCGPRLGAGHILLVFARLVPRNRLFDVFERQKQLLGIELLRALPELRPLQLAQQMPQAIDLRQRMVALGKRGIPLGTHRRQQRMQGFDVRWKLMRVLAHAGTRACLQLGIPKSASE
jgi:hypothetical protein